MLKDYDRTWMKPYFFKQPWKSSHKGKFRQVNPNFFGGPRSHAKDHMPRHKQEYFELPKLHRILSYLHSHQNFWQWFEEWQTNLRKGIHRPPPGLNIRSFKKKILEKSPFVRWSFSWGIQTRNTENSSSWWLNQPIWKIMNVKLHHDFPQVSGGTKKYLKPRPSHRVSKVQGASFKCESSGPSIAPGMAFLVW